MKPFLTAEWRKLALANYHVDPHILEPFLPYKTELDFFEGKCLVSLVGFMFLNTRALGLKIPFHVNFEEVNLRFYVKYSDPVNGLKRGVCFIREIVPRPALAYIANWLYHEKYATMPMAHRWDDTHDALEIEYKWKSKRWNSLNMITGRTTNIIQPGSEEEFILEHYWGYTRVSPQKTFEYNVEHPRWKVYNVKNSKIDVDFGELYGKDFQFLKHTPPDSVFLAEGSEIKVYPKMTLH